MVSVKESQTMLTKASVPRRRQRKFTRRHSIVAPLNKRHGYLNGFLKKHVSFLTNPTVIELPAVETTSKDDHLKTAWYNDNEYQDFLLDCRETVRKVMAEQTGETSAFTLVGLERHSSRAQEIRSLLERRKYVQRILREQQTAREHATSA